VLGRLDNGLFVGLEVVGRAEIGEREGRSVVGLREGYPVVGLTVGYFDVVNPIGIVVVGATESVG